VRAELILVGDELLEDHLGVQPVYISELVSELASDLDVLGHPLARITVVGDGPGEVGQLVIDAVDRHVPLVLTVGGLGPTHDDRVREGVAMALRQGPPEVHPGAMAWLKEAYERKGIPVPKPGGGWERMATVPLGALPVRNPVGMACGLAFHVGTGTQVRCLPGVTYEALAMWREEMMPHLERVELRVPKGEATIRVRGVREGLVGPVVESFLGHWPDLRAGVYLMEHHRGRFHSIRVALRGDPDEVRRATPLLASALGKIKGAKVEVSEGGDDDDA
jgi:molybdopterin-biosynthesis enzyme MoeA-like protein